MDLANFLSKKDTPPKRKAETAAAPAAKNAKGHTVDLRGDWKEGKRGYAIVNNPKGFAEVKVTVNGSTYPVCLAALKLSAHTLRYATKREYDGKMKLHLRAGDHPLLSAERQEEAEQCVQWIHDTADGMFKFVWDNRQVRRVLPIHPPLCPHSPPQPQELMKNWRDSSLKKSIERAQKGEKDDAKAFQKWLDSEKCFRSYAANWEQEPSICVSRSFDSFNTDGRMEGCNDVKMYLRHKPEGGQKGYWEFLGGKDKGPDVEGQSGAWEGAEFIRRDSIVMVRAQFSFFATSVGHGVCLKFGPSIAVLAIAEGGGGAQGDPDL